MPANGGLKKYSHQPSMAVAEWGGKLNHEVQGLERVNSYLVIEEWESVNDRQFVGRIVVEVVQ